FAFHSALKSGDPACHAAPRPDFGWVPASPRGARMCPGLTCAPQAVTASPAALATFTAALMSRSSHHQHLWHCQRRICSGGSWGHVDASSRVQREPWYITTGLVVLAGFVARSRGILASNIRASPARELAVSTYDNYATPVAP